MQHPRAPVIFEVAAEIHRTLARLAESDPELTQAELLAALADVMRTLAYDLVEHDRKSSGDTTSPTSEP